MYCLSTIFALQKSAWQCPCRTACRCCPRRNGVFADECSSPLLSSQSRCTCAYLDCGEWWGSRRSQNGSPDAAFTRSQPKRNAEPSSNSTMTHLSTTHVMRSMRAQPRATLLQLWTEGMLRCRQVIALPVRVAISQAVLGFGRRTSQRRAAGMASDVQEVCAEDHAC